MNSRVFGLDRSDLDKMRGRSVKQRARAVERRRGRATKREREGQMLRGVKRLPGSSTSRLSTEYGAPYNSALEALKRLADRGEVRSEREGRCHRWYPVEEV